MKLIDKDALVAEINRVLNSYDPNEITSGKYALVSLRDFLDTLEVKEVDLEKEINTYISNNFFGSETIGFYVNRTKEEPNDQDIALCAKHFFELGLNASNQFTWKDVQQLISIAVKFRTDAYVKKEKMTVEMFYTEVLKRFKDFRERKEK